MSGGAGRSALVTGGAGFIGSHLVEALVAQGRHVVVVDDLSTGRRDNLGAVADRVDVRALDLRRDPLGPLLAELDPADIFHLASHADVTASVDDPRHDLDLNVGATFRLLEAMRDSGSGADLVNISSASVYGDRAVRPFREDDPTFPVSPYATSKLAAEHYVAVFARLLGVRAASARLFPVYGPRQRKQVVFDLIRKVHADPARLAVHGDGTQVRDFNHVGNVVEALLVIADRAGMGGEVYNVAGDAPTSIASLVAQVCEASGARPQVVYSGEVRPGDSQCWTADTSRIRALGYRPRVGLDDGLAETVAWFRREAAPGVRAGGEPI